MDNATLRFDNGYIIFANFSKISLDQTVSVRIYGKKKYVAISLLIPSSDILPCHNIIHLVNHRCYNPGLIQQLMDAGIRNGEPFLFHENTYYPFLDF